MFKLRAVHRCERTVKLDPVRAYRTFFHFCVQLRIVMFCNVLDFERHGEKG